MSITVKITKKLFFFMVITVLIIVSAGVAYANYDSELLHVCLKNGSIEFVNAGEDCKNDETAVGLVTEAGMASLQSADAELQQQIDDLEGINAELQQQIDDLDAFVRRLHGDTAAVVAFSSSGGTGPAEQEYQSFIFRLVFCDGTDYDPNWGNCRDENDGFVLESQPVTEDDDGTIITFNAANSPNFSSIVDLLTNGENDYIGIAIETDTGARFYYIPSERIAFFRGKEEVAPVSAHLDINDLAGFEIGKISIVIDDIATWLDQDDNLANLRQHSRVFFGLAE